MTTNPIQPLQTDGKELSNDEIQAILLSVGYTIKPGLDDLKPYISCYAIQVGDKPGGNEILVQRVRRIGAPAAWAVRLNNNCLDKSGEWEREPMASGRDYDFLARCRFDTAESAIKAARMALAKAANQEGGAA